VSHDRTFLDNLVTQVIAFEGDGRLLEYAGGYEDWKRARQFRAQAALDEGARAGRAPNAAPAPAARPPVRARLGFKEARELADLPDRIAALEHEHAAIMQRLAEPALYRDAPGELKTLQARLRAVESELALKLERWEKLETLNSPARAPVK
jgi:ATP-binding cassette subfamily F protein uup